MRYIPHTAGDVEQMLARVGVADLEQLFSEVPASVRLKRPLDLPEPISETELLRACWRTPEHQEAVQAFIEKRPPVFKRG